MYNQNKCRCGQEQQQDTTTLVFSLVYPDVIPGLQFLIIQPFTPSVLISMS